MNILKTEPALFIGGIAAIIVIVAQQLLANGIVTSDGATNLVHFVLATVPLVSAAVIRFFVSPASKPGL